MGVVHEVAGIGGVDRVAGLDGRVSLGLGQVHRRDLAPVRSAPPGAARRAPGCGRRSRPGAARSRRYDRHHRPVLGPRRRGVARTCARAPGRRSRAAGRPPSSAAGRHRRGAWLGCSPAGKRSSGPYGVTQRWWSGEAGPAPERRLGARHRRHRVAGHQLVGDRRPHAVRCAAGFSTRQRRAVSGEASRIASDSRAKRAAAGDEGAPSGFSGPAARLRLHLVGDVSGAVHVQVEAGGEEVLVVAGGDAGGDLGGVPLRRAGLDAGGVDDPGQLALEADLAVLVQVPVVAVLVVADGGDAGDDQPAGAGQVDVPGRVVACASRAGRCPPRGCRWRSGRAPAGPASRRGRRPGSGSRPGSRSPARAGWPAAQAVLADVEDVLEVHGRVGVAVGDDHLGDRRPVAGRRAAGPRPRSRSRSAPAPRAS